MFVWNLTFSFDDPPDLEWKGQEVEKLKKSRKENYEKENFCGKAYNFFKMMGQISMEKMYVLVDMGCSTLPYQKDDTP